MSRKYIRLILLALIFLISIGCPQHKSLKFGLVDSFGSLGSGATQFNQPVGIVHRRMPDTLSYYILIADRSNHRISIWRDYKNCTHVINFGDSGVAPGQFLSPVNLALTRTDDFVLPTISLDSIFVYVIDSQLNRIQKFTLNGAYVSQWGEIGSSPGQLKSPTGIDIDFYGDLYVADYGNNRIQVFDSVGNFKSSFGDSGSAPGQLNGPTDVALSISRDKDIRFIAVCDNRNHRIQFFSPTGQFINAFVSEEELTGLDVPMGTDRALTMCMPSKTLLFIDYPNLTVISHSIHAVESPGDISRYFITDIANGVVYHYDWSMQ